MYKVNKLIERCNDAQKCLKHNETLRSREKVKTNNLKVFSFELAINLIKKILKKITTLLDKYLKWK